MAKVRHVKNIYYQRERVDLPDGDFVDLDWSVANSSTSKCILMLHGLEGSSQSQYMMGVAKKFNRNGYDVCAMNFRGCSGEPNRLFSCYHSGKTDDVRYVINHILQHKGYSQMVLHGVSLGANVVLKYLGENHKTPQEVKAGIAISAPCDLFGSAARLLLRRNFLYAYNFQNQLMAKLKDKQQQFPDKINQALLNKIKNIRDFDNYYTAPAHGFKDADDYYEQCSSLAYLEGIEIPTLIINALNDSFLSQLSYPYSIAQNHDFLYLETPPHGGHVAFWLPGEFTYNEKRALAFAERFMNV